MTLVAWLQHQRTLQQRNRFCIQLAILCGVQARLRRFHQQVGVVGVHRQGLGEGIA